MSDKMTCPVCGSHTSAVYRAVMLENENCPHCGAPGDIIARVDELRNERGGQELKAELTKALADLGRVTAERDRLRQIVADIQEVFAADDRAADEFNRETWRNRQ